jgi:glycerol-3-phosphate dehydrogenase (NAD(P)+)
MKSITILGAGVMGTAMAVPLSTAGYDIALVGSHLDDDIIGSIQARQFHPKLSVTLPTNVRGYFHGAFAETFTEHTDLIVLGVASAGVPWAIAQLCQALPRAIPIVMITKGMAPEAASLAALPDVVEKALAEKFGKAPPIAAIAGPCIAGELAVRRPTGTVIVSRDFGFAEMLCHAFTTDFYHPRPSADMMGAEVCAAFKNFFAIAVGFAHGSLERLEGAENNALNNNAAAVIFDQAVRELMVLVGALGGTPESVWGMPGVGDLYVTCMAGRNSRLGHHLGKGLTYRAVKAGPMKSDTIEGAELGLAVAQSLRAMMAAGVIAAVTLPLTTALLDALTEDQPLNIPWSLFHRSA